MLLRFTAAVLIFISSSFFTPGPAAQDEVDTSIVNSSHLDRLYEKINLDGRDMAIVHIYAEAPDYNWTEAKGEGIACVDDVARAAIFYLRYFNVTHNAAHLIRTKLLLEFLFYMQAENGLFYNFINSDHSINKEGANSKPLADWWSWRALWAMGEAYRYFYEKDKDLSMRLQNSLIKGFESIKEFINRYPKKTDVQGRRLPTWLPYQYASDQASILILALAPFYQVSKDTLVKRYIEYLASGIMVMQAGDSLKFPYGAFLSWENIWHAWGSNQPEALLVSGDALKSKTYEKDVKLALDYFYGYLMKENYLNEFSVVNDSAENLSRFPQIAYGIGPMVTSCLQAAKVFNDPSYSEKGAKIASWFLGNNAAGITMYEAKTGRCFDGIVSADKVNYNSGAESTIEALLAILAVEANPQARQVMMEYFSRTGKKKE
ncbi:MAG: hypothetical protein HF300_16890 [Ignavibacteria bacterium]|jgi:hypothetical protein|nr:hypothetical protein [Ignavibacteria bacterium]